jgi:hypothetical protein
MAHHEAVKDLFEVALSYVLLLVISTGGEVVRCGHYGSNLSDLGFQLE